MTKRYFKINTGRYAGELAVGSVSKEIAKLRALHVFPSPRVT